MKRFNLKNKASKTKSVDSLIKYKKQRNMIVKLNKNCKKRGFDNLEIKKIQNCSVVNASRTFPISTLKIPIPIYCQKKRMNYN